MFFTLLKNELKRKKMMNLVLFSFITMVTLLASSGAITLYQMNHTMEYFHKETKLADSGYIIASMDDETKQRLQDWLQGNEHVTSYELQEEVPLGVKDINIDSGAFMSNLGASLHSQTKTMDLLFTQYDERFSLQQGEIAIPLFTKDSSGLAIGDMIRINIGGTEYSYTLAYFTKDSFVGSSMSGMSRFAISDEDFAQLPKEVISKVTLFVNVDEDYNFTKAYTQQQFPSFMQVDNETSTMAVAAIQNASSMILFVIAFIMIIIAFVTLRFTIITSLEEEYHEIGVMKAIGLRSHQIRNLYLVKYIGLALLGVSVGYALSLPASQVLIGISSELVMTKATSVTYFIGLFTSVCIGGFIIVFAIIVMHRINHQSIMDAMRGGNGDERYHKDHFFLYKRKKVPVVAYLSFHDVIQNAKRFMMLCLIFFLSYLMLNMTIVIRTAFAGSGMITYLGISEGDIYSEQYQMATNKEQKQHQIEQLHTDLQSYTTDYTLDVESYAMVEIHQGDDFTSVFASKAAYDANSYKYTSGEAPKLTNEIALNNEMARKYQKQPGDYIQVLISGIENDFLITGCYDSMMNVGKNLRFSDAYELDLTSSHQYIINIQDANKEQVIAQILADEALQLKSPIDIANSFTAGFISALDALLIMVIIIIAIVLFFITFLFVKLQVLKDRYSIAVMKSMGFSTKMIKRWQMYRILGVLVCSITFGILCQYAFGQVMLDALTAAVNVTSLHASMDAWLSVVVFPLLCFLVVYMSSSITLHGIKIMQIQEMKEE